MARLAKKDEATTIEILELQTQIATFYVRGTSPLLMNRLNKKAREQLLLPPRKLNQAARQAVQKHNPPNEFRDAVYMCRDKTAPTLFHLPSGAIKKACANAALRIPGATKAEIGQLVSVADLTVHLYGVPYLHMGVVRQAGINRTPDIRTRAVFPQWACKVSLRFISNLITERSVIRLLAAAGQICGIGDGRTEKGSFDFGQWELVSADDKAWLDIVHKQGRKAQQAALDTPQAFDEEAEELLAFYDAEIVRREADRKKPASDVVLAASASRGRGRRGRNGREARQ